jgi:hypothetical protein
MPSGIHSSGNILAGVARLEEELNGNFFLGFSHLGTSLQKLVGWRKGSRGTSFWDSLTLETSLQKLVGWRKGSRGASFWDSLTLETSLQELVGWRKGSRGTSFWDSLTLETSLQELVGWRKGSRGTSFWDSLTWEHPCRSWWAGERAQGELPSGIHSSGNILAGVGGLQEGLKGNFLLGFTHLGTSLQELVGWRKGTRRKTPRHVF